MMVGRTDGRYQIRVTDWLTRMTERRWTNLTQWQTDFYCSFERYLLSSVSPSPSSSPTLSLYLLLCISDCVCLSFFVAFQFLVGCALRSGLNHVKTTTISCRRIYYCVLLVPIEVIIAIAILPIPTFTSIIIHSFCLVLRCDNPFFCTIVLCVKNHVCACSVLWLNKFSPSVVRCCRRSVVRSVPPRSVSISVTEQQISFN